VAITRSRPPQRAHANTSIANARRINAAHVQLRGGGGETRTEVAARMVDAVDRALISVPDDGTLVVVTHGGAARTAVCSMLGLPRETWGSFGVFANCSWAVLAETGWPAPHPAWRLTEYNAGSLPVPAIGDDR